MKRTSALFVAALCTLAALPASASAAKLPPDFFGVTVQSGIGEYDAFLMQQAGVDTVRVHLNWELIQRERGHCQARAQVGICDWRIYDGIFGTLAKYDLEAFPYLLNVPAFIDADPNTPPIRSKKDKASWTQFVTALVNRYESGGDFWKTTFKTENPGVRSRPVRHWEVWNEPSDGSYWQPKPNADEYAQLLEITGRAIHAANKGADVVFAGLFGTPDPSNDGLKAFDYYRDAFARKGIGRFFDSVAVHPYGPTLSRVNTQMGWVLDEMKAAGFKNRKLWITEIAWSSSEPPEILGVGPEGQARLLTKAYNLFIRNQKRWKIEGVHWYAWQDLEGQALCQFCYQAGLLTFGREPKPAYFAFTELAR